MLRALFERFRKVARDIERDRRMRPLTRQAERALAAHFRTQGRLFVQRLRSIRYLIDANAMRESVSPADWLALWALVRAAAGQALADQMRELILAALAAGGADLIHDVDPDGIFGVLFGLDNPRAVEYAQQRAAELVTQIDETTRARLNTVLTQGIEDGWSYNRIAEAITGLFDEFGEARALRIAVYEIRDAFEAGNYLAALQMQAQGLAMEKEWLTAGDDKVRPAHQDNGAQGAIPLDATFSSGHERPPTDPGCRCTLLIRRARNRP